MNRRCGLCRNYGHIYTNCNSPIIMDTFENDKILFNICMNDRIENNFESYNFNEFINRIKNTNIRLLKLLVDKYGSYNNISNNELVNCYIYNLYNNFINTYTNNYPLHIYIILNRERRRWLHARETIIHPMNDIMNQTNDNDIMNAVSSANTIIASIQNKINKNKNINILVEHKNIIYIDTNENDNECSICFEKYTDNIKVTLDCSHIFCLECVKHTLAIQKQTSCCALCRCKYKSLHVNSDNIKQILEPYTILT